MFRQRLSIIAGKCIRIRKEFFAPLLCLAEIHFNIMRRMESAGQTAFRTSFIKMVSVIIRWHDHNLQTLLTPTANEQYRCKYRQLPAGICRSF
jgi:hypothetical protein